VAVATAVAAVVAAVVAVAAAVAGSPVIISNLKHADWGACLRVFLPTLRRISLKEIRIMTEQIDWYFHRPS
ncbi:MAG: hypothetical protein HOF15_07805, partial [Planctomycetaceae bacterium]|nr:hypothetical protein [Planctomycetaceae bacterium]